MREIVRVSVSNLLLDTNNPRLTDIQTNQIETIRAIASQQKWKLIALANDIVEHGTDPSTLPIVTPYERGSEHFVVLEGNRRIAVLKILENPDIVLGAIDKKLQQSLVDLSREYHKEPIKILPCVILDEEEDTSHWVELRHTGENKGAGVVKWGGAETARFRQRSGNKEFHMQVLDFLEERGDIKSTERKKVPVTSLKRLLTTPYVRTKLGIDLKDGEIVTRFNDNQVVKGLKRIVRDLATGDIPVKKIYTKEDRIKYIDNITTEDLPDISRPKATEHVLGKQPDTSEVVQGNTTDITTGTKTIPSSKKRLNLIPQSFKITIGETKINDIHHELRRLDVEDFSHAVSVLLRVFIELSVDVYINKNHLSVTDMDSMAKKMQGVASHLKVTGKINEQQVKYINHITQKGNFLATTLTTMHQYVHNTYFSPRPSDLIATWNSLEFFISAIWR